MATSKATLHWNRNEVIKIWQAGAHAGHCTATSAGNIASLFDGLMRFLKLLLGALKRITPEPVQYRPLENNSAALFFWGRDLGVSHGELDTALQHSGRLRDTVMTVLISIGDFMSQDLIHILPTEKEREEILETSNVTSLLENARISLQELEIPGQTLLDQTDELCSILEMKIRTLNVLSSSLDCPAEDDFDDEAAGGWMELQDRSAHEWFAELVASRFPLADKQLIEILGRSNWDRYNHIQRQREIAQDEPEIVDMEKAKSEFHDSGLGSSAPARSVMIEDSAPAASSSEYAATVISSRAESSHKRLPPLPKEARSGEPFACEVCNKTLYIRRTKEWKKHVFEDICAYTCIFSDCSSARVFFADCEAMTNHLESQHEISDRTQSQACPLCLELICGGSDLISLHFSRHLEEIALAALPRIANSEDGSEISDSNPGEGSHHQTTQSFQDWFNPITSPTHWPSDPYPGGSRVHGSSYELDDEARYKGLCPLPECGGVFKDLKAHMLTHQSDRPEKCPVVTCQYHTRGFARKYDKNRHMLSHYKSTMVCDFCPGAGSVAEKSFNRADVFKRHLTSVHGVEQNPPNSRKKKPTRRTNTNQLNIAVTCSTCSVTFANVQEFYEHLDDCVLRVVQQAESSEAINLKNLSSVAGDKAVAETLARNSLPDSVEHTVPSYDADEEEEKEEQIGDHDELDDEELRLVEELVKELEQVKPKVIVENPKPFASGPNPDDKQELMKDHDDWGQIDWNAIDFGVKSISRSEAHASNKREWGQIDRNVSGSGEKSTSKPKADASSKQEWTIQGG